MLCKMAGLAFKIGVDVFYMKDDFMQGPYS